MFPPDRMSFITLLRDPAFQGRGLISNNYVVPFGFVAGTWAYIQAYPRALTDSPQPIPTNDYVWLADRRTNAEYSRPSIYVCFNSLSTPHALLAELSASQADSQRCSNNAIVKRAQSGGTDARPHASVLARDTESDHWAILRLEWSSPR
jgi:hypothetical protein